MTKQGRPSISGRYDGKVEPNPRFVNPGAVSYLGEKLGNHATDHGDFPINATPWSDGRGYRAPGIGQKRHKSGSQGEY
jgi:hypothetical protein